MKQKILFTVIMLFTVGANAGNAWYWGTITKIKTIGPDGSFQVNFDNDDIKTYCAYDRVGIFGVRVKFLIFGVTVT